MQDELQGIAVIGMACRFPGARDAGEFWRNLRQGIESIHRFSDEELTAAGVPAELLAHPSYVKAAPVLADVDRFDAPFFGFSPREAELTDPQQRLFLECAWEALENAGHAPGGGARVGVYAGQRLNTYLLENVYPQRHTLEGVDPLQVLIGNEKDYLATQVAYRLDLNGPAIGVQTACSTALVAASLACQGLMSFQCDLALAGAVSVRVPPAAGYLHQEGGISSPDGHCRAFDAAARGTVFGSGLGIVVLRRLEDALAGGDTIHAVIKGWAVNNDGAAKAGYTAPSQSGQADVIAMAQAVAGVEPESIGYVEAHGTGTPLGDPVEVAALEEVFRAATRRRGFCALGSVKTNIGHLDTAAGVAGLIKAVLALEHREIPPSLHYERPNPQIDFAESPFYVNARLAAWEGDGARRAGVSSFGIGGTNAHLVLEEAPPVPPVAAARPLELLVLSARTAAALERATARLAEHLRRQPGLGLSEVAHTLQVGRRAFEHRRAVVVRGIDDAAAALGSLDPKRVSTAFEERRDRPVAFLFPGQGSQHSGMGHDLYRTEGAYRDAIDECAELLRPALELDLRTLLHPAAGERESAAARLARTEMAQPALFAVEYALAKLWMSWGIQPRAMAGHSVGEYVAACLAGVFCLEDALGLVAARGRLIGALPGGAMLSVPLPERELLPRLGDGLAIAAVNGPALSTVAGPDAAVAGLEERLAAEGVASRRLQVSHAFHSPMMEPALAEFARELAKVPMQPPRIPLVSTLTDGAAATPDWTDPAYWTAQLRQPVRFGDALASLFEEPGRVLLEVGPGTALATLAQRHPARTPGHAVLSSMPHPASPLGGSEALLEALGGLWLAGVRVDWAKARGKERRRRIQLPTYPFEPQRHWLSAPAAAEAGRDGDGRFAAVGWKQSPPPPPWRPGQSVPGEVLVFADACGLAGAMVRQLRSAGAAVTRVVPGAAGSGLASTGSDERALDPADRAGYLSLLRGLAERGRTPAAVVHSWSVTGEAADAFPERLQDLGFYSLLHFAQAVGETGGASPLRLLILSDGMHRLGAETRVEPVKATLLGPTTVIPQEYPQVRARSVDVVLPAGVAALDRLAGQLLGELQADLPDAVVAYRGAGRWVRSVEPLTWTGGGEEPGRLRQGGVYLITGGLGGVGLEIAAYLARTAGARLVLTGRSPFPARRGWEGRLAVGGDDEVGRKIRRLLEIEEAGGEVLVVQADVADLAAMRGVLARVHERFGPLHGVVHAAGLPGGGAAQLKSREAAAAVLAPKVAGTLVLDELLRGEELDFVLLCSSTFALRGGVGRIDYCAANAFLDAFAHDRASLGGSYTVAVDWDGWAEVGMAARAVGGPEEARRPSRAVAHPLLGRRLEGDPGSGELATFLGTLSAARHWPVAEHRVLGEPVLPGTAVAEMLRAAAHEGLGEARLALRGVAFLAPLHVPEGAEVTVRTALRREGERTAVALASWTGAVWREHATAEVTPLLQEPRRFDLEELRARFASEVPDGSRAVDLRLSGDLVSWGPRWSNLEALWRGVDEGLAVLQLPAELAGDLAGYPLHPALLDVATACGASLLAGGSYLPLFYGALLVFGPLPERLWAHFRRRPSPAGGEVESFDISLLDGDGVERVRTEEFILRRIAGGGTAAGDAPLRAAAKPPIRAAQTAGITPAEGVEAFGLVLARGTVPQVVVAPARAAAPRPQAAAVETTAASGTPSRGHLKHPYVAPSNAVESALAEIWQQGLGFAPIGIHDDFFQLGGHSVLAIQLISRIRETFEVELPLDVLFEANTVADLAALLVRRLTEQADGEDLAAALAELEELSFEEARALATAGSDSEASHD